MLGIIEPTTRRQMRRLNMQLFGTGETPEQVEPPITKLRRVIFSKAGGFLKGRYEGRSTSVFGDSPLQISKRLKFFDGGAV